MKGVDLQITPCILEAIRSTKVLLEGFFDLIRIAFVEMTVSMASRPAAFIVSPDSKARLMCCSANGR